MDRVQKISLAAVIVSIFAAVASVYSALYAENIRSFFGNGELVVRVIPSMNIQSEIRGIIFSPEISVENIGIELYS